MKMINPLNAPLIIIGDSDKRQTSGGNPDIRSHLPRRSRDIDFGGIRRTLSSLVGQFIFRSQYPSCLQHLLEERSRNARKRESCSMQETKTE